MANTIKVIDLLNKIANGEEVPKKIKHWKEEYERDESGFIKYESKTERNLCLDLVQCLNDEVEIIEEEPEIDIQGIKEVNHYNICSINRLKTEENINDELSKYSLKINELVQAVKQLDNKIKEK